MPRYQRYNSGWGRNTDGTKTGQDGAPEGEADAAFDIHQVSWARKAPVAGSTAQEQASSGRTYRGCHAGVLDSMGEGVALFDADFRLRFINRQYLEFQNYPPNQAWCLGCRHRSLPGRTRRLRSRAGCRVVVERAHRAGAQARRPSLRPAHGERTACGVRLQAAGRRRPADRVPGHYRAEARGGIAGRQAMCSRSSAGRPSICRPCWIPWSYRRQRCARPTAHSCSASDKRPIVCPLERDSRSLMEATPLPSGTISL